MCVSYVRRIQSPSRQVSLPVRVRNTATLTNVQYAAKNPHPFDRINGTVASFCTESQFDDPATNPKDLITVLSMVAS